MIGSRRQTGRATWSPVGACAVVAVLLVLLAGCSTGGAPTGGVPSPSPTKTKHATPTPKPSKKATARPKPSAKPTTTSASSPSAGVTRIVFVDVGQGDGIIVRNGSWTGLIDGGPGGEAGAVEAQLARLGATRIDTLVATHAHADHVGDLAPIVYRYRPREVVIDESATTSSYRSFRSAVRWWGRVW